MTSLEITLVDLQTPLDNLGWNQFIYLRNDSEEIPTIIAPCVHVRDEITDLQIGFRGLYEHNGSRHACDNNWTIDGGETAQGTSVRVCECASRYAFTWLDTYPTIDPLPPELRRVYR